MNTTVLTSQHVPPTCPTVLTSQHVPLICPQVAGLLKGELGTGFSDAPQGTLVKTVLISHAFSDTDLDVIW